jgi:hypothetical protein
MTIVDMAKKFGCSELRNSEMARTVIELSDFVNLVNPPTSTLKLKMLKLYDNFFFYQNFYLRAKVLYGTNKSYKLMQRH